MPTLGRIKIFLEVARLRSFTKAAKVLGITGPAASKQVVNLEASLGVKLLHRTTRHVSLTDDGQIYYERARRAVDELNEATAEIRSARSAPRGSLRISAPMSFSHARLLPVLSGFARKYPEIVMEVMLEDRHVDVIAEGFDVVIRIGVMSESNLICRPVGDCPLVLVASPDYLARHGEPDTPAGLRDHRMIVCATTHGTSAEWRHQDGQGQVGVARSECVFRSNTAEMKVTAALDSIGIALLPIFSIDSHLREGRLVRVLPDYETHPRRQMFLLMPPNRHRAKRVRLFVDWLMAAGDALVCEAD